MLRWIILNTVRRPVAVIMSTLLLLVLGIVSVYISPVNFYPSITVPKLTIATSYEGLPAREIRELITIPIEDAFSSLQGLKNLSSSSIDGISIIELKFSWGTDMKQAGIQARELADITALQLPENASKPIVLPVNPAERPVIIVGAFPKENMDITLLKRLCDREIRTMLQQAEGVGSVQIIGGLDEEILIEPFSERMGTYGLTIPAIADHIRNATADVPAGSIEEGPIEFIIKTESIAKTKDDIKELYIPVENGQKKIKLSDIAVVSSSTNDRDSFLFQNNQEGVALLVRIQGGFSPVTLSKNVGKKIRDIQQAYGNTLNLHLLQDSSVIITSSINNLVISGIIGILAAFIVILLFMKNIPSSFIVISSIPLSLLATLAVFPLLHVGINIMSIGGLAIGIGMLIDNSVVVLENIQRKANKSTSESVAEATIEIANSTFGSTITSLIVFLPLFFLPGIIGIVFRDMAWAVCLSLLSSFLVSISVIPVLFLYFGAIKTPNDRLEFYYRKSLRLFTRKPLILLCITVCILITGVVGVYKLDKDWLNTPGSAEFEIKIAFPSGTRPEHLMNAANSFSSILESQPYIESFFFFAGGKLNDPYYLASKSPEYEIINCRIKTEKKYKINEELLKEHFTGLFSKEDILDIEVSSSAISFNDVIGIPDSETLTFPIPGSQYKNAYRKAEQIASGLSSSETRLYPKSTRPQFLFTPKWEAIHRMNIDSGSIAQMIGSSVYGMYSGSIETPTGRIPIRIRLPEKNRSTLNNISKIAFPYNNGSTIVISDVIDIKKDITPPVYYRSDRQDIVNIDVSRNNHDLVKQLRSQYTDTNEKEWKNQIKIIFLLFSLSIFLMYVVLGIQFDSFILPIILLLIIPVGFSGVIIAIMISGKAISLNGILGSLVVIGIIVNNGIILYDHYSNRIANKYQIGIGIYRGSNDRIRAISVSFFTSVIALLPVALNLTGKNPQSIMALSIIGGLVCANFISIYAFPSIFSSFFKRRMQDKLNDS